MDKVLLDEHIFELNRLIEKYSVKKKLTDEYVINLIANLLCAYCREIPKEIFKGFLEALFFNHQQNNKKKDDDAKKSMEVAH